MALTASLGLLRPVSRTARGLRAPRLRRPSVPALRTACARASSRFAASNGQRPGRECIFPFRTVPQFSMVVPLRSQARLWHSLLHWAYSALFRAQRARFVRPSPSLARCSGAADAFWACPRASSRFAAFACALRVLAPPAASRPPTASGRDGNAFLPTVRNRRSTSHAKRACGSCCSLGLLRPVSATGGGLRAHPQFAMVVLLRLTACSTPLLIGLTSACFAHCARPSCAPQKCQK